MKLRLIIFVLILSTIASLVMGCQIENRTMATVTYKYVNFRSSPNSSTDDNIICQILKGEVVEILAEEGNWYKVLYWGQIGYLFGESVKISDDAATRDPRNYEMKAKVIYKYVNFRSTPTAKDNGNIICQITKGKEVDVISFSDKWMEVSHNEDNGYLIGKSLRVYLEPKKAESKTESPFNSIIRTNSEKYGTIIYNPVNFRSEPNAKSKSICEIQFGTKVEVLAKEGEWVKIRHNGKEGYVISESISTFKIIFDISDYNWGSEFSSIGEFKEFTKNALENLNFGGYYVQVVRSGKENKHWREIVKALDEMAVPYGLYVYCPATTQKDAQKQYNFVLEVMGDTSDLKYLKFPLMVDLEGKGNQIEVVKFYNKCLQDNYIVYSGACDMVNYGYYKLAPQFWVAHYDLCKTLPTAGYTSYSRSKTVLEGFALWQFTSKGNKTLVGTEHLDMNIVTDEWYKKYVG